MVQDQDQHHIELSAPSHTRPVSLERTGEA